MQLSANADTFLSCNAALTGIEGMNECNCGQRNLDVIPLIVNGTEVFPHEYPSLVYLSIETEEGYGTCGGTISKDRIH